MFSSSFRLYYSISILQQTFPSCNSCYANYKSLRHNKINMNISNFQVNNSVLMWSYCDVSHQDINNIQVPLTSSGNELLIQYYSAKGSYDGQEFTYTISYRFIKKSQNSTTRRQVQDDFKLISLRPVNFSALNFNESENCNCDFGDRIGSFKNWFMVLVVLGIVSFLGAIFTIIALLAKCIKMRSMEKKLLQTPKL